MEGIRLGNDRQILQGQSYQSVWGSLKIFRGIGWVSKLVYYSSTACSAPPPPTLRREVGLPFSPGQVRHQKQRGSVKAYISIIYVDSQCVVRVLGTNSIGVGCFSWNYQQQKHWVLYFIIYQFSSQKQCSILLLLIAVDQIVTLVSRVSLIIVDQIPQLVSRASFDCS